MTNSSGESPLAAQNTHLNREQQAVEPSFLAGTPSIHPPELRGDPQKSVRSPEHHSSGLTLTLLHQAEGMKAEPFENHSALEIAEQLTLLDHLVFKKIPYE